MVTNSDTFKSFLIIRLSSLGDILLTTPAIRALRNFFPSAKIDFLVKGQYVDLLKDNPHLSSIINYPETSDFDTLNDIIVGLKGKYDVVIDLHTSLRSFQLRRRLGARKVLRYDKLRFKRWLLVSQKRDYYPNGFNIPTAYVGAMTSLGVKDDGGGLEWPAARLNLQNFLDVTGLDTAPETKPIALCPGASYPTKRWPREFWVELTEQLLKTDRPIWIFGDESDRETGSEILNLNAERIVNFCGKLGIAESGSGLSHCRYAVTHDAGPMHMAAAVGTPMVAIFGSTTPRLGFGPFRIPHRIAEIDLTCRPCSHLGFDECPKDHFQCMKDLRVERVLELVAELEQDIGE